MASVNSKFTPDELESIFIWDLLCEAMPLTAEERRDIRERDTYASTGKVSTARVKKPMTEEQRKAKNEAKRRWREEHKEQIAAYREAHRQEIRERQRAYDQAKSKSKRTQSQQTQP